MSLGLILKFFKPWAIITYGLIVYLNNLVSGNPVLITDLLSAAYKGLPLFMLFWLYEYDLQSKQLIKDRFEDLEKKIDEKYLGLKRELNENEDLLQQLWNGFSHFLTDRDFDSHLRELVRRYPVIESEDFAIKNKTVEFIIRAKNTLEDREFIINFGRTSEYPEPYYDKCDGEILATNIGSVSEGFWGGIEASKKNLIKVNHEAIQRNIIDDESFRIRRLFILEKKDFSVDLYDLMSEFIDIGVEVKYISRQEAEMVARNNADSIITKLEDFTLFIQKTSDLCFSGRLDAASFEAIKQAKNMRISTNKKTINGLKKQFEALWESSIQYVNPDELQINIGAFQ